MPLAWVKILIPAERERQRDRERQRETEGERERERESGRFSFYAFNSLLMFLDFPIFCRIGQFYHL